MDVTRVAREFVGARRTAKGLSGYPGPVPADLGEGYAIQDAAMALWPDEVAGWKAGLIAPERRVPDGDERLVGPIWSSAVRQAPAASEVAMPVYAHGFAAVEAEFVVRLDAPAPQHSWSPEAVASVPHSIFAGVEIASSPLIQINDLGPAVTASDFGNNAGLIIGPAIPAGADPAAITVRTELDGTTVGQATGAAIPGGILASVAQTLNILGRRGRSVPAGTVLATGAVTGVHAAAVGQSAVITFGELPPLRCRLIAATPADEG